MIFSAIGGCFHVGGLACAMGYMIMMMLVNNPQRKVQLASSSIIMSAALLVVGMLVLSANKDMFFSKIGGDVTAANIVAQAGGTDRASDAEYSVGIPGLNPVADLIVNSPIRVIYFIGAPLPWMFRGISDILAFFGSAIFYIMAVVKVFKVFKEASNHPHFAFVHRSYLIVMLTVLLIAMLMFGWGVSNVGTALRHREKFTCLFGLVYAIALTEEEKQNGMQLS